MPVSKNRAFSQMGKNAHVEKSSFSSNGRQIANQNRIVNSMPRVKVYDQKIQFQCNKMSRKYK